MGITQKSLDRLQPYIKHGVTMLELGAQNIYSSENYGEIAKDYFNSLGVSHYSIDIIAHQRAEFADLREDLCFKSQYDIVTNFGTLEHVYGSLYQPFKNIHEACKVGGIMVHENPKTGNWPDHGQHYFTKEFYEAFSDSCGYKLVEVAEEPAMGNTADGWNVCAVFMKAQDTPFITEKQFNKIYKKHIYAT